jgi:hypothetical protein
MPRIDDYENAAALNMFRDELSSFKESCALISKSHYRVACAIADTLLCHGQLDTEDANHPFQSYATDSKRENIRNLSLAMRGRFQQAPEDRAAVVSFFHSGGAYHDDLLELMDDYYKFADFINGFDSDSDSEEDDDASENDSVEGPDSPLNTAMIVPRLQGGPFAITA